MKALIRIQEEIKGDRRSIPRICKVNNAVNGKKLLCVSAITSRGNIQTNLLCEKRGGCREFQYQEARKHVGRQREVGGKEFSHFDADSRASLLLS